ncbi:MAG: MATE family efflux transporter, partial [Bacteroidales bacterium]
MKDLTTGSEKKLILFFAIPMLLGNVFQQSYNIIDRIIVGHYIGKQALAAVGAAFPIIFLLISLIIGIASGITVIISQYFGAKDYKNVKRAIDTMYLFIFISSLIITGIGLYLNTFIFEFIKLPKDIIPDAKIYLSIYFIGMIFMFGFQGVCAVLRGLGDSKTPLYFLVVATILNIALDFLFIVVLKFNISGVAIATVISQFTAFIAVAIYLNKKEKYAKISFKNIEFDKNIFRQSIRIGLPSGAQQAFVALGMIALYRIVNDYGTNAVAAYSVATGIDSFATLPAMNFSMALSAFVGQNIGANKVERVYSGYKATLLMNTVITVILSLLIIFFGKNLMHLFTDDKEVIDIGTKYLVIVSAFYMIFTIMFITNGLIRGAGDTLASM